MSRVVFHLISRMYWGASLLFAVLLFSEIERNVGKQKQTFTDVLLRLKKETKKNKIEKYYFCK